MSALNSVLKQTAGSIAPRTRDRRLLVANQFNQFGCIFLGVWLCGKFFGQGDNGFGAFEKYLRRRAWRIADRV